MTIRLGDRVRFEEDGESLVGIIVNIYILPKEYDLVDIQVGDRLFHAVSTEGISLVE